MFKKEDPLDKANYRPISILPTVSNIFERIFNQLCFSNKFPSPLLRGFRKGYSTQYALINGLQKWRRCLVASDGIVGTLIDLSKAYDCVNHGLIIAKLEVYGVGENSLRLVQNYFSQRRRVKVNFRWMVRDYPWGTTGIFTRTNPFQCFYQWFASVHKRNISITL